jgi:hypothetical protein
MQHESFKRGRMTFRVGQKVICIDDSVECRNGFPARGIIRKGKVYTVRALGIADNGEPGLRLDEVVLTSDPGCVGVVTRAPFVDACYRASRFRPPSTSTQAGMTMLRQSLADHLQITLAKPNT